MKSPPLTFDGFKEWYIKRLGSSSKTRIASNIMLMLLYAPPDEREKWLKREYKEYLKSST